MAELSGLSRLSRPASSPRGARAAAVAVVLLLGLLGPLPWAAPASAHATVAASWPANGQVLTAAPDHVLVEFTTEVSPDAVIAIVDPQGTSVTVGQPTIRGRYLSQRIKPTSASGLYVAGIHVIAKDLHPIVTRLEFTVDPAAAATTNPAGTEPDLRPTPPAAAASTATFGDHFLDLFPGLMTVSLAGLAALVIRRQSRTRPV